MDQKKIGNLAVIILSITAGFSFHYIATHDINRKNNLSALLTDNIGPAQLAPRTKMADCLINNSMQDFNCTPGSVFPDATIEQICTSGYTKAVRNVSASLKKQVYTEYGIDYPQTFGSYEADHLIPLELGGDNEISNLWPEAADPAPGFHQKDVVENYLHQEVCAGRASLASAQELIAKDWLSVYNSLTPDEITTLQNKFKSWADKK